VLGQGSVADPLLSELLEHALGYHEGVAIQPDVLPE
jgi:hypothetical protein